MPMSGFEPPALCTSTVESITELPILPCGFPICFNGPIRLITCHYDAHMYTLANRLAPLALMGGIRSAFIEVRVQAVRLKLRPRPAMRLTLAL